MAELTQILLNDLPLPAKEMHADVDTFDFYLISDMNILFYDRREDTKLSDRLSDHDHLRPPTRLKNNLEDTRRRQKQQDHGGPSSSPSAPILRNYTSLSHG